MRSTCVAIPGAFNALAALAIAKHGFEACYISGAATSVSAGVPDVGLLTHEHFAKCIREAYDASGLPIIADADTGFGEAEMLRRVVIDYAKAGAAGLHIEDQKFPKRCGHLDGKELVPVDHMVEKVQWAVKAAKQLPGSDAEAAFIVCARTDARGVEGFDAAVRRAAAYVQAGAEMIFPEGLTSEQEFGDFAKQLRAVCPGREVFLLANMTEFGKTPIIPIARFQELGYNCVIYPVSLLRIAMGAVDKALSAMKRDGSVSGVIDQMQTRKELYELIAYTPGVPWEYRQRD
jgi:methylisocitrate lyase